MTEVRVGADGRWSVPLACLGLLVAAALTQWGALNSPMLAVGDLPHALGNPGIRKWDNLAALFSPSYYRVFWEGSYHPLVTLLYAANYHFFGIDPAGFRVLQFVLLWSSGFLAGLVGRNYVGRWAWAAAVLYVVHPFQGESVGIMVAVRDQLVAFLLLLALAARGRSPATQGYGIRSVVLAGLYLAALLCKETAVVFPVLLLCHDWALGLIPTSPDGRRRWLFSYCLLGLALAAYGIILFFLVRAGPNFGGLWGYAPGASATDLFRRIGTYVSQMVAPWAGSALASLLLVGWALLAWSRDLGDRRGLWVSGVWILAGLLPVSGLLPVRPLSQYLAGGMGSPHHLLLPGVGFCWLLASLLRDSRGGALGLAPRVLAGGLIVSSFQLRDPAGIAAAAVRKDVSVPTLVSVLVSQDRIRARAPNDYAAYRALLASSFGAKAAGLEAHFADALQDECRGPYLIRRFKASDFAALWSGVRAEQAFAAGCLASQRGDFLGSLKKFRESAGLDPAYAHAHLETARALWRLGDREAGFEALLRYERIARDEWRVQGEGCRCGPDGAQVGAAMRRDLDAADAAKRAGIELYLSGDRRGALERLGEAARLQPSDPETLLSRGVVKDAVGDFSGALADYDRAVRLLQDRHRFSAALGFAESPRSVENSQALASAILTSRAEAWLRLQRPERAAADLERALREAPPGTPEREALRLRLQEVRGSL